MVSNWIAQQVHERDWTIRRFGRELGVSATHAGRLVNGVSQPSPELARVIARVFGLPEQEVFEKVGLFKPGQTIADDELSETMALIVALPEWGRSMIREVARMLYRVTLDK